MIVPIESEVAGHDKHQPVLTAVSQTWAMAMIEA